MFEVICATVTIVGLGGALILMILGHCKYEKVEKLKELDPEMESFKKYIKRKKL